MNEPDGFYHRLLDHGRSDLRVEEIIIGLVWTYCRLESGAIGLAISPGTPTRTLPWSGTLRGKQVSELAEGIRQWEPYEASVAMAAINAVINAQELPQGATLLPSPSNANLAVFDYFLPRLIAKEVVVVGHYPGLDRLADKCSLTVLERHPGDGDLPDPACEFLIPRADWVFLTATSIPNKTFPRLTELARNATTVLMGPTVPWLPDLHEIGIDYLAGIEIADSEALRQTVAEGGGVRIFDSAVRYRAVELTPELSLA